MTDQTQKPPDAAIQGMTPQVMQALLRAPMPRLYANSIGIAQTSSDVSLLLIHLNSPIALVSMSYTTAKSLVADLDKTIKEFEKATKQKVKQINEITEALSRLKGSADVVR